MPRQHPQADCRSYVRAAESAEAEGAAASLPPQDIAEGTALVEAFLEAWSERTGAFATSGDVEDRQEAELKELVDCFESFKDRFDSSRWTKEVLAKTY